MQNMYERHNIFTAVHEWYVVELVRELFTQLRRKSPFNFVSGNYIPVAGNTRRKPKDPLAKAYSRNIRMFFRKPLLNMLELFTCTLMLPATFIMII